MLGPTQVRALGRGSNDVVGTHQEIVGSSPKVSKACQEFAGSSPKVSRACREFVGSLSRVIRDLPRVRRELAGNALGVCQKMTKTHQEFTGGYQEDC
ncbi:hypothetical protein B296_00001212 [Ensete ventricosum]|uniref:Uncharacterized protein n=1 Tax=Ensete ventricosum TaxID=4639 RepID=A0A427AB24_ENSVE|nr:hypothetical protein B296_00001212 [Ensete ventricosum]